MTPERREELAKSLNDIEAIDMPGEMKKAVMPTRMSEQIIELTKHTRAMVEAAGGDKHAQQFVISAALLHEVIKSIIGIARTTDDGRLLNVGDKTSEDYKHWRSAIVRHLSHSLGEFHSSVISIATDKLPLDPDVMAKALGFFAAGLETEVVRQKVEATVAKTGGDSSEIESEVRDIIKSLGQHG